jgi:hypothetical protein
MSRNLGALTFWKPVGLFRLVMGQLYVFNVLECSLCSLGFQVVFGIKMAF